MAKNKKAVLSVEGALTTDPGVVFAGEMTGWEVDGELVLVHSAPFKMAFGLYCAVPLEEMKDSVVKALAKHCGVPEHQLSRLMKALAVEIDKLNADNKEKDEATPT